MEMAVVQSGALKHFKLQSDHNCPNTSSQLLQAGFPSCRPRVGSVVERIDRSVFGCSKRQLNQAVCLSVFSLHGIFLVFSVY